MWIQPNDKWQLKSRDCFLGYIKNNRLEHFALSKDVFLWATQQRNAAVSLDSGMFVIVNFNLNSLVLKLFTEVLHERGCLVEVQFQLPERPNGEGRAAEWGGRAPECLPDAVIAQTVLQQSMGNIDIGHKYIHVYQQVWEKLVMLSAKWWHFCQNSHLDSGSEQTRHGKGYAFNISDTAPMLMKSQLPGCSICWKKWILIMIFFLQVDPVRLTGAF